MSDKRSVHTDALATLGTIIDDTAGRDAIHLAVEPVIAGMELRPGQDIGLINGEAFARTANDVGIVDPFLKVPVRKGERFWLIVYPRTITSLRHVWEHPAFAKSDAPPSVDRKKSIEWLKDFCESHDCPNYETVIDMYLKGDIGYDEEYFHFDGWDAHGSIPDEFWDHMEVVTGMKITNRPKYFSCSC